MEDYLLLSLVGALFVVFAAAAVVHFRSVKAKLYVRSPAQAPRARKRSAHRRTAQSRPFHSVSVVSAIDDKVCEASLHARKRRFLAQDAPPLPLPGCDLQYCPCVYQHHVDRRTGYDRRHPIPRHVLRAGLSERRTSEGRRESDYAAA